MGDIIRAAYLNDRMDDDADTFGVDTWINEPALWLDWMTCGSLIAVASSDVVTLNVETFRLVIKDFAVSKRVFQRYARASIEHFLQGPAIDTDHWDDKEMLLHFAKNAFQDVEGIAA